MDIQWTHDETEPDKPMATIYLDAPFQGNLTGITGVQMAYGLNPITILFYSEGNVDLAMREIIPALGRAGAIIGTFCDSRSGVSWP